MKQTLRNMKEFLYDLGGRYYIIGMSECRVCDNAELIALHKQFVALTNAASEEFSKKDPRDIFREDRDRIAKIYRKILITCSVLLIMRR